MIKEWADKFMEDKETIRDTIRNLCMEGLPTYDDLVKLACIALDDKHYLDPDRIHCIDDGHYQGTLLYVIGARGYQPSTYHFVKISYGSCSVCDTLQAIQMDWEYDDDMELHRKADNSQCIDDLLTLVMHIVQGLGKIGD